MEGVSENKLISAVLYKDITEVEKVLTEGVDINQQDGHGYTALIWACSFNSREAYFNVVNFQIENGANVNAKNVKGQTPLSLAEEAGNTEIIKILKAKGAIN